MSQIKNTPTLAQPERELDVLVATKVMGRVVRTEHRPVGYKGESTIAQPVYRDEVVELDPVFDGHAAAHPLPHYSTDIATAWRVVERLPSFVRLIDQGGEWMCDFTDEEGTRRGRAFAPTPSEAICRAALAMVSEPAVT